MELTRIPHAYSYESILKGLLGLRVPSEHLLNDQLDGNGSDSPSRAFE